MTRISCYCVRKVLSVLAAYHTETLEPGVVQSAHGGGSGRLDITDCLCLLGCSAQQAEWANQEIAHDAAWLRAVPH